jgi:hypothetical protein
MEEAMTYTKEFLSWWETEEAKDCGTTDMDLAYGLWNAGNSSALAHERQRVVEELKGLEKFVHDNPEESEKLWPWVLSFEEKLAALIKRLNANE